MELTPGEPVPPGFEEEVKKAPHIQSTLDQYKGNALIGVEYTAELHELDRHEPGYICVLCDKRGDARTILSHWSSFNHRVKYLEKHYPTVVREFQPVKYKPNSHNILILIVQSLAEAIEDYHGRLQVKIMDADEFRRQKTKYTENIMSAFHHDEKNGPNFLNALDRTLFEQNSHKNSGENQSQRKPPKRFNNSSPTGGGGGSTKTSQRRDDFDAISSDSDNADSAKKSKPNSQQQQPAYQIDERNDDQSKKLPTPKELSLQASHIAQERYKWEKYRCMLEIQLKQMEKLQKDYEKSPEKHPHYPEEWKKFWNRRYKELQAEKKVDPNKYDYKPEWIIFWTKRMKELFNAEVDKKKKELKLKIGLPEEAEEKVDQLKERYRVQVNSKPTRQQVADIIDISDDDTPYYRRGPVRPPRRSRTRSRSRSPRGNRGSRGRDFRRRSRSRSRSRSLSSFSDDYDMSNKHHHHAHKSHRPPISRGYNPIETGHPEYYQYASSSSRYASAAGPHKPGHYPSHSSSGAYRILDSSKIPKYEDSNSKDSKDESVQEEETGPLTVVGVLRLLTALEEHLGSLGPKVVDLLGKALALEKVKANSSDDLLLNEDHCVFFETIKEKLKGLLIADVLDDQHKVRAVKRAIKNIAGVIHQVTKGSTTEDDKKDDIRNDAAGGGASTSSAMAQRKAAIAKQNAPNLRDLPFDRQTIATKLAAALVVHGREDVSTEDMDKLIYLFLLMVKLSKPKRELDGRPLYCKNILPELGLMPSATASAMAALAALPGIVEELLENENSATVAAAAAAATSRGAINENDFDAEIAAAENDVAKATDANSSTFESLTDSDLQTLLQNFKHLSSDEQHHLIAHLKKLESVEPTRVEKLRKFVNLSDLAEPASTSKSSNAAATDGSESNYLQSSKRTNTDSPVSANGKNERRDRAPGTEDDERITISSSRPSVNPNKFSLDDDDDDDYNFDEVFKAASKNVNNRTPDESSRNSATDGKGSNDNGPGILASQNDLTFNPAGLKDSFSDTHNLIANLMGSLQQSNSVSKNGPNNKAASSSSTQQPQPVPPPPVGASQQTARMTQQHPQQQQQQQNMAYYQQQQAAGYQGATPQDGVFNQMQNASASYYNAPMGGYNQAAYGGPAGAYPQWGGQPNMQPATAYGMHNYGMPPNQGQHTQHMGYNMYGQGGGN